MGYKKVIIRNGKAEHKLRKHLAISDVLLYTNEYKLDIYLINEENIEIFKERLVKGIKKIVALSEQLGKARLIKRK
jgi:hypothetical protein